MYEQLSNKKQAQLKHNVCPACLTHTMIHFPVRRTKLHLVIDMYCTVCKYQTGVPIYLIAEWKKQEKAQVEEVTSAN